MVGPLAWLLPCVVAPLPNAALTALHLGICRCRPLPALSATASLIDLFFLPAAMSVRFAIITMVRLLVLCPWGLLTATIMISITTSFTSHDGYWYDQPCSRMDLRINIDGPAMICL